MTRFQEIHTILSKSVDHECLLWKGDGRNREKHPVVLVSISDDLSQLAVRMKEIVQGINPGDVVFLKLDFREAAVRVQVVERVGPKLVLEFPTRIAFEENRRNPRFYFHPSEEKMVQIRTPLPRQQGGGELLHHVLVCDISRGGIAIFVSSNLEKYFEVSTAIKLWALATHRLVAPVQAEILFKIPYKIRGNQADRSGYKIGIRFEHDLNEAALDRFLAKNNLFQLSEESIVGSESLRSQVVAGIAEVRKTLSKRREVREFLEAIEKSRVDGHYIRQHILLLSQVMTGIGTKLGWVSARSVDKLIYVAYLHDIRLGRFPHLARIPSKKEFDKVRGKLSESEQTAYLEAPYFSSEIARRDLEAYPDVIKMLSQQRELPDGSGFPTGATALSITPLSALFIVCHLFVDYVIEHPDWSPNDFVRTFQRYYRGQYFQKVFEAFID